MATKTPELIGVSKNIMGTLDLELKFKGMRKPQDFIVYPIAKDSKCITIQSDTRIAQINLDGTGAISKSHQNGAFFPHLQMDVLTRFKFAPSDWKQITDYLGLTAGDSVGDNNIKSDNSGAKSIFDL